jgi:outer membrane protein insertion porin family
VNRSRWNKKKQKNTRGLKLALTGLVLGLLLGILKVGIERSIESMLVELLNDEAQKGCPTCSFQVDEVDFSLLALRGVATNARIVRDGIDQLTAPKLVARFNPLSHLSQKRLALTSLQIFSPILHGVSPSSGGYQFIEELARPLSSEQKAEWKIRIKLLKLEVIDGRFVEQQPFGEFAGTGMSLLFLRNENDDLTLTPRCERLSFSYGRHSERITLGELGADLFITDETVSLREIALTLQESFIKFKGLVDKTSDNLLSGHAAAHVKTDDLINTAPSLSSWLAKDGAFLARGSVRGTPDALQATASIESDPAHPLFLPLNPSPLGPLNVHAGVQFDHTKSPEERLKVSPFEVTLEENGAFRSTQGIHIANGGLQGEIAIQFQELATPYGDIRDGDLSLVLETNKEEQQRYSLRGTLGESTLSGITTPPLDISVSSLGVRQTFSLEHRSKNRGSMILEGEIAQHSRGPSSIDAVLRTTDFTLWASPELFGPAFGVAVSGEATLQGPLDAEQLSGTSNFTLHVKGKKNESPFHGDLQVEKGVLTGNLQNTSHSVSLQTTIPLQERSEETPAHLSLSVKNLKPAEYVPDVECLELSLTGEYSFLLHQWQSGDGELSLTQLDLGCEPYRTVLSKPRSLSVENGTLQIEDLALLSTNSNLVFNGSVDTEELSIDARGSILLKSFLPILPFLDDLSGELILEGSVQGELQEPNFRGIASIREGGFAVEALDLSAYGIIGDITFSPEQISLDSIYGTLNGGKTVIRGTLSPRELLHSDLTVEFEDLSYQPEPDTYLRLSGELHLRETAKGVPLVQGGVDIENAEVVREFDVRDLLKAIPNSLLKRGTREEKKGSRARLPRIALDLALRSPGNIFAITTFFGVESEAALTVRGTLETPIINGGLTVQRGWVGFQETRFEITSATARFRPPLLIPELSLLAEASLRGSRGEQTVIFLEANGPLFQPRVRLSSDQGLQEREILSLLGTSSNFRMSSAGFTDSEALEIRSFTSEKSRESLVRQFFDEVTRIDNLAFQPKFNARRGQLEPALIAEKSLLPKLDLLAESFLSGPEEGSQLFLRYALTPRLQAIATLDTVSTQSQSSVGADIAYTVLSKETQFVTFHFAQDTFFSKTKLLEELRLSRNSQIRSEDLNGIAKELRRYYREAGFLDAEVEVHCTAEDALCRAVYFKIAEGERAIVTRFSSTRDLLPLSLRSWIIDTIRENPYATQELQEDIQTRIIRSLRADGFLQARVSLSYEPIHNAPSAERLLSVQLHQGNAVRLHFEGNEIFTSRELLETINLFERKHPFGNNTVSILAKNIERLYREAGYLYATVHVEERKKQGDQERDLYNITIREESYVSVEEVVIQGLLTTSEEELAQALEEERAGISIEKILSPTIAVREEIQQNEELLEEALRYLGFTEATVKSSIIPHDEEPQVLIRYTIEENERTTYSALAIDGAPPELSLPSLPTTPYSPEKVQLYTDNLLLALEDEGYYSAIVRTERHADSSVTLVLQNGPRERVASVEVLGNIDIPSSTVLEAIALKPGSYWTRSSIQASRAKLLTKGLFSRVRIERRPITSGQSVAVITVLERPLQTLDLGGGINSVFGVHFFGEAIERELFLDGRYLSLRFDTFYDDTEAEVSRGLAGIGYTNPTFTPWELSHTEDLRFEKLELPTQEFDLDRISFASSLTKTEENLSFSFSHTIFREDLSNVTPGAVLDPELDTGETLLSFLSAEAALDGRDDPLTPTDGYNLRGSVRLASAALGSDADYFTATARASYLYPFTLKRTNFGLATAMRSGVSIPFGEHDAIPISQRFYLGGRTTLRGFRENSLGPRGADGAVLGGDLLVSANNEFRYFPTPALSLHTFLDLGTVYLRNESINTGDLRYSTGVGFRYLSPIGPVGSILVSHWMKNQGSHRSDFTSPLVQVFNCANASTTR